MPHSLPPRQRKYLDFIRQYIRENESSPRLEEIAKYFGVKSPTAHKTLRALQSKGYLYFGRDSVSGFFIRLPERIGTFERLIEINVVAKVNRFGELLDFPKKFGHFPAIVVGADREDVFAVELWHHIPIANIQAGDYLIFDQKRKPKPDNIGIISIGKGWFLARLYSLEVEKEYPFFEFVKDTLSDWDARANEQKGYFFWWPLAHSEETAEYFAKVSKEENIHWGPITPEHVLATAIRLDRPLTF